MPTGKMHQTTVRFGTDLWQALEEECSRLGLSVAQYLREAALARLVYAAGRRGDEEFEFALELALGERPEPPAPREPGDADDDAGSLVAAVEAELSPFERAQIELSESSALWAQGRQARRRAQELRDEIRRRRLERG